MGFKDWNKPLVASIAFAIVGLGMLIAGSVMLGVGVSRFNSKTNCGACPTCSTCPSLNLTAVYTSSYTNAIQYSDSLNDPTSEEFKNAVDALSKNISDLLDTPTLIALSFLSVAPQSTVIINSFKQPPNGKGGVNFYASILYPYNGMSTDNVQQQMSTMYPTNAAANPTSEQICSSVAFPPGEATSPQPVTVATKTSTSPAGPNGAVTTTVTNVMTVSTELTTTLPIVPSEIYCQAQGPRSIIFVIDTAVPAQGTLEDKLAKMRNFLSNYDKWIGLRDSTNWNGVQMQYGVYNSQWSSSPLSAVCYDSGCWQNELNGLYTGIVNSQNSSSHYISMLLDSIYGKVYQATYQSRSIIIISDGLDVSDTGVQNSADKLKTYLNYQISVFLASPNPTAIDQFQNVATSSSFFYGMSSLDYLTDATIQSTMASWSCQAPYPLTTTQSTRPTANTPPMPKTTTSVLTTTTAPAEPTLVRPCTLYLDTMILLHASSSTNWDIIRQFVIEMIFPALTGPLNNLSRNDEDVRIGQIVYSGSALTEHDDVFVGWSTIFLAQLLNETTFTPTNDTNRLSWAYNQARSDLSTLQRLSTPTVLVITDEVDQADIANATYSRTFFPSNAFVYGIRVGFAGSGPIPGQNDGMLVTDIQQLNPLNVNSSVFVANTAANALCRYIPLTTTPATTSTQRPTPRPVPNIKARNVWPDITILIDSTLQNVSFFETQRDFVRKTFLDQYQIGGKWSQFSIATYSNATNIVCKFSDILSYWDFNSCLDTDLSYDPTVASSARNIDQALSALLTSLYGNVNSGFRSLKENFLFVFTNGKSTTNFYNSALALKKLGIRVIGIDISSVDGMSSVQLSDFGPDSYKVSNWLNPIVNDQLSQSIIVQTTMTKKPAFSSFFADFYVIVDNSLSQAQDLLNAQQFVKQFSEQLNINPHHSRISIVPFSDKVMPSLPLTDDPQAVSEFLIQWRNSDPGSETSNIEAAVTNVLSQINTVATDTSSQIVYIVGANSTTGAESSSSFANMTSVTSYVLQYNPAAKYSGVLVNDPSLIYKIDGSSNLMNWAESQFPVDVRGGNPMNQFFLRVTNVQENQMETNFPMSQIAEDIVIILDETGLTADDFESIKLFLFNFTNTYSVDPQMTRFAMQTLSGNNVSAPTWYFSDSLSNDVINKKIESMQLIENLSNVTSADITTAVNNVLSKFLTPSGGWRNSTTTTVIISNAKEITYDSRFYDVGDRLEDLSDTYGYSLAGQYVSYMGVFVQHYYYLDNPEALNTDNTKVGYMIESIYSAYKQNIYPPPIPFNRTEANFVFLVDNTNSTKSQAQIRTFLQKVATASPYCGISVVNYDSQGEIPSTSWTLNSYYRNRTMLTSAIQNLQFSNDTLPPNLDSAIGYFASIPSLFGIRTYPAVFVVGLFSSSTINKNLTQSVMANVNLKYYTFAIQYGDNSVPFNYLPQFSGSDYAEDFVYVKDISDYDTTEGNAFYPFNAYIQSESVAYQNSYGNN